MGRVGELQYVDQFRGIKVAHIKDANNKKTAVRADNIMVIGKPKNIWITLPADKGLKLTPLEKKKEIEQKKKKKEDNIPKAEAK